MLTPEQLQQINWQKIGQLLPIIIQHAESGQVLMLGYMNHEALNKSINNGIVTFYSRSKQRLWTKGESSGNHLCIISMHLDCDQDSLLILVEPKGPTCHTGTTSCFNEAQSNAQFLYDLQSLLASRKFAAKESSYTASLYHCGTKRIAQKVGEEGVEVALAAMVKDKQELANESADLLYHLLVLLQDQNMNLQSIIDVLRKRHSSHS